MRRVVLILRNRQSFLWLAWGREGKAMKQVMPIKQNLAIMRHLSFLSKLTDHSDVCVAELEIRHRPSYFQLAPGSTAPWWIVQAWSYIIASFILIHLAGFSLRWLPPAAPAAGLNRLCTGCGGKLRPSFSLLARKLLGTAPVVLSNWEPLHRTLPHLQCFQWCLKAKDPFCLHFW